jgi:hypothetical protein
MAYPDPVHAIICIERNTGARNGHVLSPHFDSGAAVIDDLYTVQIYLALVPTDIVRPDAGARIMADFGIYKVQIGFMRRTNTADII